MVTLSVVGGTEAGDAEALPVWEDPNGTERVLRNILRDKETVTGLVVVYGGADGHVHVSSNFDALEQTMGMLHRGLHYLSEWGKDVADQRNEET